MKTRLGLVIALLFSVWILAGCQTARSLDCEISTEQYSFSITGEKGDVQTSYNGESQNYSYDNSGQVSTITININEDLTYLESDHTYHVEGVLTLDVPSNTVTYDITATGDGLAKSGSSCKKP